MHCIVTTTIYSPSAALLKYSELDDWKLIVVGDHKTPHHEYRHVACEYLTPARQDELYPDLSRLLGWNTIDRRNIGLLYAYDLGADVIASVDDDNYPYDNWGRDVYVNREIEVACYQARNGVFDPLSVTTSSEFWHRGYPVQLLSSKNDIDYLGKVKRRVLVQANLWDGDPDVDGICRLLHRAAIKFDVREPYASVNISPFNSQNVLLSREVIPYYTMVPFVGRMDDIWASYILQHYRPGCVVYDKATVFQARNEQDVTQNIQDELLGYKHTSALLQDLSDYRRFLPDKAAAYLQRYAALLRERGHESFEECDAIRR